MYVRTIDGLWTLEFGSSVGVFGGGVVVLQDGKVRGGDAGYFYLGEYQVEGGRFLATVDATPFIEGYESLFKTIGQPFRLHLEGSITDESHAIAQGSVVGIPHLKLGVKLTKRS